MPPRKGIVKSGNAGNASKSEKKSPSQPNEGEKPLFPPNSKYPLSLLHERCHKQGWEKPSVETQQRPDGWTFVVYLSKINKKTNQKESIRLAPNKPYLRPSSLEARHWGATYALYRFCNGIQLHLVLPPGPRDYWNELAVEHKSSPPHQKWMYASDPFAAQDKTKANSAIKQAATLEDRTVSNSNRGTVSDEFSQSPEVKMAAGLREQVEDAIKMGISLYPETDLTASVILDNPTVLVITQQLQHLGFTVKQARKAINFLSQPSRLASSLLRASSSLEASIEYLVLHLPECDLPQQFLPANNSSNPFISSAHTGADDLRRRWMEDKAIKVAGWPAHVVKECTSVLNLTQSWDHLLVALGGRLVGDGSADVISQGAENLLPFDVEENETEALGASIIDGELVLPLFSCPAQVHILLSPENIYPRPDFSPIYITSSSIPAYVRLHLLTSLLTAMKSGSFSEPGEGFCMTIVRILEGEWAKIEDNGPPDVSVVLANLMPRLEHSGTSAPNAHETPSSFRNPNRQHHKASRHDKRTNDQIKKDFNLLRQHQEYTKMLALRKKLPAFAAKENFLQRLEKSRVVVVVGETGCGKTTQLPQFLLDSLIESGQGSKANILVTQPRRISAISVAARVSAERLEDGSVGYAIRGESKQSERTKLLFCTTGVVLRRLGSGDALDGVSHVVVDEVHERSVDGDILLLELKELLTKRRDLKVVLMSATINHETFVRYFNNAPLLTIPGMTYPVADRYLEDLVPLISYKPLTSKESRRKGAENDVKQFFEEYKSLGMDETSIAALHEFTRSDRIDFQLIASVVDHIVSTANVCGAILIFLPGVQQIHQCMETMHTLFANKNADIFPLHANLSNDDQRRVFSKSSGWKIIAATNIAETSITIDDVIYVVDTGKVKEMQYDAEASLSRLVEKWVTRAAARQRRGRAGRTQPGICYRLYTRKQESTMDKFPVPEILRVPLESVLLMAKVTRQEEDIKLFLNRAIDCPKMTVIDKAWSTLEELGAVSEEGQLTPLGRHMAQLPVDLRLSKMLILATVFSCLDPVLTIAAVLSSKPLFFSPMDKRDEAYQARSHFSTAGSDLLTDLAAYNECSKLRAEGKGNAEVRSFCEQRFISPTTIREITALRHDFSRSLADLGFTPTSNPLLPELNKNSKNLNLVKGVVLGGLWPRVARVHLPRDRIKFDKVQAGTIQRDNTAKEYKIFDLREGRVFLHPASVLFGEATWKSPFLVYFHKYMSSKVFLRDATEVPLYALLLFGGQVSVDQIRGGLRVGNKESWIKLRAWPRIGILVNHLRRLVDAQLERCVEGSLMLAFGDGNPISSAILSLLAHDGLTE